METQLKIEKLTNMKNSIERMDKPNQIEVLRLLSKKDVVLNENKNGIYIIYLGPISCGISATSEFKNYTSGIFADKTQSRIINHFVTVYGWGQDSNGTKYSQEKIKLFKLIQPGGCWINLPLELQKEYLKKSFNSSGGKRGILARLSMEKPSLTLLCSPSQKQTERCHPLEERPLTIREYARIQTFPDNYEFIGSLTSQYKQIGNAVPVELAYHLGLSLKKLFI